MMLTVVINSNDRYRRCTSSQKIPQISRNLTTNESFNVMRYEHLWIEQPMHPEKKLYANVWDQGSRSKNCFVFWKNARGRSELTGKGDKLYRADPLAAEPQMKLK